MAIELTDDQGNQYLIPETVDQGVIPSMINEQMQGLGATPPQQGGFMNALATALASPQFRQLIEPSMTRSQAPTSM